MEELNFSSKIIVDVESTAQFNVVQHLEGIQNQNINYIQDKTGSKLEIISNHFSHGFAPNEDNKIYISIIADSEEHLNEAEKLCQGLVQSVKEKKVRNAEIKARKSQQKSGKSQMTLPEQFLLAMKAYFPGDPAEPPPPGSAQDLKIHKWTFPQIAKRMKWLK